MREMDSEAPKGWKLVPIEPTPAMLVAVSGYSKDQLAADATWRAMIASAPDVGAARTLDPNKMQICRVDPVHYDSGQPCNCPAGTCRLWKGSLRPAAAPSQGTSCQPSGETMAQREEVCAAWADLPAEIADHPAVQRLYISLGGIRPRGMRRE